MVENVTAVFVRRAKSVFDRRSSWRKVPAVATAGKSKLAGRVSVTVSILLYFLMCFTIVPSVPVIKTYSSALLIFCEMPAVTPYVIAILFS